MCSPHLCVRFALFVVDSIVVAFDGVESMRFTSVLRKHTRILRLPFCLATKLFIHLEYRNDVGEILFPRKNERLSETEARRGTDGRQRIGSGAEGQQQQKPGKQASHSL